MIKSGLRYLELMVKSKIGFSGTLLGLGLLASFGARGAGMRGDTCSRQAVVTG